MLSIVFVLFTSVRSQWDRGHVMKCMGIVLASVVSLSLVSPFAAAQTAPTEFLSVLTVTAKPSMIAEYEAFVRQIKEAARQIGDAQSVQAYQVKFGGPINQFQFVTGFNEWQQVDGWLSVPEILIKAHGQEEAASILQSGTASIESFESTVSRTQHDLTNIPSGTPSRRFARVTRTEIDPSTAADYQVLLSKRVAAQKHLGLRIVRRAVVDGAAGLYTAVEFYDTLAERDQVPNLFETLTELFGEAEMAQIVRAGSRGIRHRQFSLIEHRPDLSR